MEVARAFRPAQEAVLVGAAAASLAALLLWLGPPGNDLPAHLYQRQFFIDHGFAIWNNFWYSGRYSFVTYSVVYYPLAAVVGINVLALASVASAAVAFTLLVVREWGPAVRLSGWAFAVLWPGTVLSATYPFSLGAALALLSLCALQSGHRRLFVVLAALSLAASPLAFAFLAVVLAGVGVARWRVDRSRVVLPLAVIASGVLVEVLLVRLFPSGGRYPFGIGALIPALAFSGFGLVATLRLERARLLAGVFAAYAVACFAVFLVPVELGGNITRLRYAAVPLALLAVALRGWRPLRVVVPLALIACVWNVAPLAGNFQRSAADRAVELEYWQPAIGFLEANLSADYRVEVVDTVGHWPAVYLPEAGIPLARGWYRQDDFPENEILYRSFGAKAYRSWLRRLAVRYVVLPDTPSDYSAKAEASLLRSGRSGLDVAFRSRDLTIFTVPRPRPLVSGPAQARVLDLQPARMAIAVSRPGMYRVAVHFSPYWQTLQGCVSRGRDGMVNLNVPRAGVVELEFVVDVHRSVRVLTGSTPSRLCP